MGSGCCKPKQQTPPTRTPTSTTPTTTTPTPTPQSQCEIKYFDVENQDATHWTPPPLDTVIKNPAFLGDNKHTTDPSPLALASSEPPRLGVSRSFCLEQLRRLNTLENSESLLLYSYMDVIKEQDNYKRAMTAVYLHHQEETDTRGKPLVATATVFVSHAWNMGALGFFEATLTNMADDDYAWIDMFMYTQYGNGDGSTQAWIQRFESLVGDIGRVVAIITPWNDPIALRRIWCLFELICAMRTKAELKVVLPAVEETSLRDGILSDCESVMQMLTTVKFDNADATRKDDLNAIHGVVAAMEGGSHQVDVVIHDYLRQWVSATTIAFVEEGGEGVGYAQLCSAVALLCNQDGNHDKALEFYFKSLKIRESVLGTDHPDTATNYNNIGSVYRNKGDHDKALEYYLQSLTVREHVLGTDHPDTATVYHNLGLVYNHKGDFAQALSYDFKSLAIREKLLGTKHLDTATSYNIIGLVYSNKGDYDRALKFFLKSLKVRGKILGRDHPDTATNYNNIGSVYMNKGNNKKALKSFLKSLKICEKVLGTDHPSTANTYNNIASVYAHKREYDKALEYFLKNLKFNENVLGTDHPDTATCYSNIGVVYKNKGDHDKALEYYFKSLKVRENILGTDQKSTAGSYNNIGLVFDRNSDNDKALEYHLQSQKTSKSGAGATRRPANANSYGNVGLVYDQRSDHDKALEFFMKDLKN